VEFVLVRRGDETYNPRMRVREAKDFLVVQTAEQAALEGMPLSELEKRMMYFTESAGAIEDPVKLNEEFEAHSDSDEYESKIAKLLHHAHERAKKESDNTRTRWDDAIKSLRRGDHYLPVMWDLTPPRERPRGDNVKLFLAGLGIAALIFVLAFVSAKLEPQWRWLQKKIPTPNPHVLLGIFLTIVVVVFVFPRRAVNALGWILDHVFSGFLGPRKDEKDSG
jgi:hypothetical protein